MTNILAKVERARKHLHELDGLITAFFDSRPYKIAARPHPVAEIRHTTLYVESIQPIPLAVPIVIGDILHNLRSSLDHLAWQLVLVNGGTPDRQTYFPITDPAKTIKPQAVAALGKGMSAGAQDLIRNIQPAASGDHTLWQLHQLDNIDKHRLVISSMLGTAGWTVEVESGLSLEFPSQRSFALKAGAEIVYLPTFTYSKRKIEDFKLSLELLFDEPDSVPCDPVLQRLAQMADFTEALVARFEPRLV